MQNYNVLAYTIIERRQLRDREAVYNKIVRLLYNKVIAHSFIYVGTRTVTITFRNTRYKALTIPDRESILILIFIKEDE